MPSVDLVELFFFERKQQTEQLIVAIKKMVRAWYMDSENTDQRLEHHRNPPKFIDLDELFKATGVEYFQVNYPTTLADYSSVLTMIHC